MGGTTTDPFSVRWSGALIPPISGSYQLGARGSSGYRLILDGQEVLPLAYNEHEIFTRTASVTLEAGRLYDLRLEYVNDGRDPQAQLLWAIPGQDFTPAALEARQQGRSRDHGDGIGAIAGRRGDAG